MSIGLSPTLKVMAEGPAFSHDGCGTSPPAIDIVLPVHLVDTDWKRDRVARLPHVPVDVVVIADQPADLPIQLRLESEMPIDAHEVLEQRLAVSAGNAKRALGAVAGAEAARVGR